MHYLCRYERRRIQNHSRSCRGYLYGEAEQIHSHCLACTYGRRSEGFAGGVSEKYYDARHVCYAYMLGPQRKDFRANDNGEPSGTAGKPILGQINSNELTDILIIVVRYFGGIKLGTSGLIVAYKAAAAEALAAAEVVEKTVDECIRFWFEYPFMNDVMRVVKEEGPEIVEQGYDMDCRMTLRIRSSLMPRLRARLEKVETLRIEE